MVVIITSSNLLWNRISLYFSVSLQVLEDLQPADHGTISQGRQLRGARRRNHGDRRIRRLVEHNLYYEAF